MKLAMRLMVECAGTAWLVFAGCASVALNGGASGQGLGAFEMAVAFGIALAVANFAAGRAASAHFNPAVTIGYSIARRFPVRDIAPYIAAQTAGAILGAAALAWVAGGRPGFALSVSEFGGNGYGDHSPGDFTLAAVLALECAMSFAFVTLHLVMSGSPGRRKAAPAVLGAALSAIYLITIPVSNGGINPARSTGPALFIGDWALDQLWLFWAAPMAGAITAGLGYRLAFRWCANLRSASDAGIGSLQA